MKRDFHYYCIAVLARSAGFSSEEALTLAYASQYTDDSYDSERFPLKTPGGPIFFDPVRTTYRGLGLLNSMEWSAQKRVWIPFHFLPLQCFDPGDGATFRYEVRRNSPFAQQLLDRAAATSPHPPHQRLCAIGIALHTFSDTWAHEGFSGQHSPQENDVESIHLYNEEKKKWEHPLYENIALDVVAQIGHAEADSYPDCSFLRWRLKLGYDVDTHVARDNTGRCHQAARIIYEFLRSLSPHPPVRTWDQLKDDLYALFRMRPSITKKWFRVFSPERSRATSEAHLKRVCQQWREHFHPLFGASIRAFKPYNPDDWSRAAFKSRKTKTNDRMIWEVGAPRIPVQGFWNSHWVAFHRAALRQRHFVLENLP